MASKNAAWLWDGALHRIVWANPAGIRFFGGETLFDIIDLVFDPQAEATQRIAELASTLKRGEAADETLAMAGAEGLANVECRCVLHALADGRDGVLVMANGPQAAAPAAAQYAGRLLKAMPMAVAVADAEGAIVLANDTARNVAGERGAENLAALLGDAELACNLIATAEAARAAMLVRPLTTAQGKRDFRISLRRMDSSTEDAGPTFLVLAEDVTERRKLERLLSGIDNKSDAEPGSGVPDTTGIRQLSAEEAKAFARLGQDLTRDKDAIPPPPRPVDRPPRTGVHPIIQRTLDARAMPCVIYQGNEALCVNQALAALLGYAERDDVLERGDLIAILKAAPDGATIELVTADRDTISARVRHQTFPWNTGPVPMATLSPLPAEPQAPAANEPEPVETSPASDSTPPPAPTVASPTVASPAVPEATVSEAAAETPASAEADEGAAATDETPAAQPTAPEPAATGGDGNDGFAMPADELRNILDTASDGIITLDHGGHILGFSAGAEAIFGYGEAEVEGKPIIDLVTTASRRIVRDYLSAFDNGGMASVFNDGREIEAVVKQGGVVPLFITIGQMTAAAQPDTAAGEGRQRPAFCVVVRDITQWKKTEAELRGAKEEAERASRQKSEFLANISHELRTPLNAILGFSDVMRSERFGEMRNDRYRGYAHDIHTSGEHLLSLINDLLDLSKVEAGKLELNFTSVNLASLVDECVAVLQDQATAARVVLRKSVASGTPNVVADLRSMKQILLNLLSNAIKFTDAGGQIIISLKLMKSGELALSVKDTGIGMSENELAKALEPFQRIEHSGREEQGGTGLGLPLTRALAEANRTRFSISSKPKHGTQVEITFPVPRVLA